MRCVDAGDTAVVFIAGFNDGGDNWDRIEPALSGRARVCSYARFGTGTSDPPTTPQSFATSASDLHALLSDIGEPGPYVVVGHPHGGAQAVTFAARYPDEVDGLVLLDATPPAWIEAGCAVPDDGSEAARGFVARLSRSGPPDRQPRTPRRGRRLRRGRRHRHPRNAADQRHDRRPAPLPGSRPDRGNATRRRVLCRAPRRGRPARRRSVHHRDWAASREHRHRRRGGGRRSDPPGARRRSDHLRRLLLRHPHRAPLRGAVPRRPAGDGLDAVVDPEQDLGDQVVAAAASFDHALADILDACGPGCPITGDPQQAYQDLAEAVRITPLRTSDDQGVAINAVGLAGLAVTSDEELHAPFYEAIAHEQRGDGTLLDLFAHGFVDEFDLGPVFAINCGDVPHPTTAADVEAVAEQALTPPRCSLS